MRAVWKKDKIISIKLSDNLFSLAQMASDLPLMQFFDIFNEEDTWEHVDLNTVPPLFLVPVGNIVIQELGVRKLSNKEATPKTGNWNHYFIIPEDNAEGYRLRKEYVWRGGYLVDVGEDLSVDPYCAPVVVPDLKIPEHCDLILKHEFANMYGDNHVKNRLLRFYKEGINEEPMKEKVFPELYKCKC